MTKTKIDHDHRSDEIGMANLKEKNATGTFENTELLKCSRQKKPNPFPFNLFY